MRENTEFLNKSDNDGDSVGRFQSELFGELSYNPEKDAREIVSTEIRDAGKSFLCFFSDGNSESLEIRKKFEEGYILEDSKRNNFFYNSFSGKIFGKWNGEYSIFSYRSRGYAKILIEEDDGNQQRLNLNIGEKIGREHGDIKTMPFETSDRVIYKAKLSKQNCDEEARFDWISGEQLTHFYNFVDFPLELDGKWYSVVSDNEFGAARIDWNSEELVGNEFQLIKQKYLQTTHGERFVAQKQDGNEAVFDLVSGEQVSGDHCSIELFEEQIQDFGEVKFLYNEKYELLMFGFSGENMKEADISFWTRRNYCVSDFGTGEKFLVVRNEKSQKLSFYRWNDGEEVASKYLFKSDFCPFSSSPVMDVLERKKVVNKDNNGAYVRKGLKKKYLAKTS